MAVRNSQKGDHQKGRINVGQVFFGARSHVVEGAGKFEKK
jgi:hypothetical protein